jgi:hypothetical protein
MVAAQEEIRLASHGQECVSLFPFARHEMRTDPAQLARAGFVFMPEKDSEDLVKCPYCQNALDGWEATDDPW